MCWFVDLQSVWVEHPEARREIYGVEKMFRRKLKVTFFARR